MDLAAELNAVLVRLDCKTGRLSPREVDVRFDPSLRKRIGAVTNSHRSDLPYTSGFDVHTHSALLAELTRPIGRDVTISASLVLTRKNDDDGRFVLVGVPDGKLSLRVSRNGEPRKALTLTVPADEFELCSRNHFTP